MLEDSKDLTHGLFQIMKTQYACSIDLCIHIRHLETNVLTAGERVVKLNPFSGVFE